MDTSSNRRTPRAKSDSRDDRGPQSVPPHLSAEETDAFLQSPEGLRTILIVLDRLGPNAWGTLPAAVALLEHAQRRFAPVASSWSRPVEDATYAAFLAMRGRSAWTANDPWAVVTRAVELSMQAEAYGERLLISPDKARRRHQRPAMPPVRAGDYEEFLYDVVGNDAASIATDDADNSGSGPTITTAAALLTVAGWREANALWACEYVASRMVDMGSQESAIDVLRRDPARMRVGLNRAEWAHLLTLLIGSKPRTGKPGGMGVFARILVGETLPELLADSDLVAHAQRTAHRDVLPHALDDEGESRG